MSALAFTIVALVLVGPVPAVLARASWPLRAPRAAIVLWQSVALAAVLSAFSAGIAIASRLFVPGADGRPSATITSEIDALGLPLWIVYVVVFALTLVVGGRLVVAVIQVAIATRRRRAHHRMLVDLLGASRHTAPAASAPRPVACASSTWTNHWPTAYPASAVASWSARARSPRWPTKRSPRSSATNRRTFAPGTISSSRCSPRCTPHSPASSGAPARWAPSGCSSNCWPTTPRCAPPDPLPWPVPSSRAHPGRTPSGALAAGGPTTVIRVRRLGGRPNSLPLAVTAYLAAAGVLIVPTIALAVPWLTELQRLFAA